jgi:hypothetical protein
MPTIIGLSGRKRSGKDTVASFVDDVIMGENGISDEVNELMSYGNMPAHPRVVYTIAFAQPLKQMCVQLFGWTEAHVNGDLKEVPDRRYPRESNVAQVASFWKGVDRLISYWFPKNEDRAAFKEALRSLAHEHRDIFQSMGPEVLTPRFAMQALGTEFGRWMSPNLWVNLALRKAEQAQPEDIVVITDVRFLNEAQAIQNAGGVVWKIQRDAVEDSGDTHASELEQDAIVPDLLLDNNGTLEDLRDGVRTALADLLKGETTEVVETPLVEALPFVGETVELCPGNTLVDDSKVQAGGVGLTPEEIEDRYGPIKRLETGDIFPSENES